MNSAQVADFPGIRKSQLARETGLGSDRPKTVCKTYELQFSFFSLYILSINFSISSILPQCDLNFRKVILFVGFYHKRSV